MIVGSAGLFRFRWWSRLSLLAGIVLSAIAPTGNSRLASAQSTAPDKAISTPSIANRPGDSSSILDHVRGPTEPPPFDQKTPPAVDPAKIKVSKPRPPEARESSRDVNVGERPTSAPEVSGAQTYAPVSDRPEPPSPPAQPTDAEASPAQATPASPAAAETATASAPASSEPAPITSSPAEPAPSREAPAESAPAASAPAEPSPATPSSSAEPPPPPKWEAAPVEPSPNAPPSASGATTGIDSLGRPSTV